MQDEIDMFSPDELQNFFDAIKKTDDQGREFTTHVPGMEGIIRNDGTSIG